MPFCFLLAAASLLRAEPVVIPAKLYNELEWRCIGPYRGGRTVGIDGVWSQPNVFYIGVNNGGVWKTTDYGQTWNSVFDDQPTGSIGCVAVAQSNPQIVYAGSGEGLQRPDLSVGNGVHKSTDAGRHWKNMGLTDGQQIAGLAVDPSNPNRVFVAVLGHPYGPNPQRGVFRTLNGGKTVRTFKSSDRLTRIPDDKLTVDPRWQREPQMLMTTPGAHRFVYDLRLAAKGEGGLGMAAIWHDTPGHRGEFVKPGQYRVHLVVTRPNGVATYEQPLEIRPDPRAS